MPDGARRAIGDILDAAMPFLRRYGRALCGDQATGDMLAAKARRLTAPSIREISAYQIRLQLYGDLHRIWTGLRGTTLAQTAARHQLQKLTPNSRETLLLRAIEEFSQILRIEIEIKVVQITLFARKRMFFVFYTMNRDVFVTSSARLSPFNLSHA